MVVSRERNGGGEGVLWRTGGSENEDSVRWSEKHVAVCSISGEPPPSGATLSVCWDGRGSSGQLSLSSCFWSRAIACWPLGAKSGVDREDSRRSGNRTLENRGLASSSWTSSTSGSCLFLTYFRSNTVAPGETNQAGKNFPSVYSRGKLAKKRSCGVAFVAVHKSGLMEYKASGNTSYQRLSGRLLLLRSSWTVRQVVWFILSQCEFPIGW